MSKERYSIKTNSSKTYDVYLSGFCPMYCGTFESKEEAKSHIKNQKQFYTEMEAK